MGHKNLIDGAAYDTTAGRCLVAGVGYGIQKGRTLADGVGYDVSFAPTYDPVLENNEWETIRAASDEGVAESVWSVGDTKMILISGTVTGTSLNVEVGAVIIGFNHNASVEGSNRIHFQLGKIGDTQVALVDSRYGGTGSSAGFRMNTSNTNSGGWNSSYGRKTLLGNSGTPSSPASGSLLAALPSDLRAVMKSVTKYTDNTGNESNTSGAVTSTVDYLFFLAEFEVQGTRKYANQYEQNYQLQYDFYKAGNSKVRYKHNATGDACRWWCRSACYVNSKSFCRVLEGGTGDGNFASYSRGVAPGFCV